MLPPFLSSTDQRQKRSLTQDVIPILNNIIFQYTNPLSFEQNLIIYILSLWQENIVSLIYVTSDRK